MSNLLGKPIPAFSLQDDQGATVTAKDLKGHWLSLIHISEPTRPY